MSGAWTDSGSLAVSFRTSAPMPVPPAVGRCLRVAVGAQELEILEPVVEPIAVDVVQLHVERLPFPLTDPAPLAAIVLEASFEYPRLEVESAPLLTATQERVQRQAPGAR